ncbi:hypothetical protein PMZ80_002274 [Knufia obscura]|uniref:L-tryptophan decarboxylase PsiD-like domain-containing protein n=2 Tax=Knufia TaxID=430999 RepID=A0AAN8EFZ1_9EURO|nr:hypothetical protein PMZ80_002274 [Knufia obscura]KAK5950633.1 hypothetical protein OHC33_008299 [Knufia fluminis]
MSPHSEVPDQHRVQRPGLWLPEDHRTHQQWLEKTVKHVDDNPKEFHPVVKEFQHLIETSTRVYQLVCGMYDEIPSKHPYDKDPSGKIAIRDYQHMLEVLNHLLTTAPSWSEHSHEVGLVGLPIYALFDWPMGTTSGFAFFLDPEVNAILKKVLNAWGDFLTSPESASCLDDSSSGWFGDTGRKDLTQVANLNAPEETRKPFEELFQCDPNAKYHGYKSWDHFFTREFNWEHRPVASPDDQNVLVNSCESTPYRLAHDVARREKFWIKGMPYSVLDILNFDETAEQFVGGTIYQAFLSALSYHRWHSPTSGKIVKIRHVDGTYYSEPMFEDFGGKGEKANFEGETDAQAYLSASAARALIFIEADNPAIGLMCVVQIGMSEVSSCDVTVKEGQRIEKGEQLGMFHFGGSTHCVMFRKGVKVSGFPEVGKVTTNWPVRAKLALVEG